MRRLAAAGAVVLVVVAGVGAWRWNAARSAPPVREARAEPRVTIPKGARIRVEVRNDSRVTGLARRATFFLRDQGFDVVDYGTGAPAAARDSTLVIDRSGHPAGAALVARALGGVNDQPEHARQLAKLARDCRAFVNLIPLHAGGAGSFTATPLNRIMDFARLLRAAGIETAVRKSRGTDIAAACGQLRVERLQRRRPLGAEQHGDVHVA